MKSIIAAVLLAGMLIFAAACGDAGVVSEQAGPGDPSAAVNSDVPSVSDEVTVLPGEASLSEPEKDEFKELVAYHNHGKNAAQKFCDYAVNLNYYYPLELNDFIAYDSSGYGGSYSIFRRYIEEHPDKYDVKALESIVFLSRDPNHYYLGQSEDDPQLPWLWYMKEALGMNEDGFLEMIGDMGYFMDRKKIDILFGDDVERIKRELRSNDVLYYGGRLYTIFDLYFMDAETMTSLDDPDANMTFAEYVDSFTDANANITIKASIAAKGFAYGWKDPDFRPGEVAHAFRICYSALLASGSIRQRLGLPAYDYYLDW